MRLTRKNPTAADNIRDTYRIPFASGKRWKESVSVGELAVLGEVADKLGAYEDLGEPEEIKAKMQHLEQLLRKEAV